MSEREKDMLSQLCDAVEEVRLENYEVVEIDLTPTSHKALSDELTDNSQEEVFLIKELMGIPVIVSSSIPNDKMWVIRKKRRDEIENE